MNQHTKRTLVMDSLAGEHITTFCKKMAMALQENRFCEKVKSNFNGVTVIGDRNTTAEELIQQYFRKRKGAKRKYRQSAIYKRSVQKDKNLKRQMREEARVLIQQFKLVDKTDLNALLTWLYQAQPYSDHSFVKFPRYQLAQELKSYGYIAGENTDENFVKGDKVNEARWIIGQCISGFERGYPIHSVFQKFINEWKENFEAA